jgi:hypothetical protein
VDKARKANRGFSVSPRLRVSASPPLPVPASTSIPRPSSLVLEQLDFGVAQRAIVDADVLIHVHSGAREFLSANPP